MPEAPAGDDRLLAVAGLPGLGGRGRGGRRLPGPVHLNLPLREPLVPGCPTRQPEHDRQAGRSRWTGGPGGAAWTRLAGGAGAGQPGALELPWTERGVSSAVTAATTPAPLAALAEAAGWPVLAEPRPGRRRGPTR